MRSFILNKEKTNKKNVRIPGGLCLFVLLVLLLAVMAQPVTYVSKAAENDDSNVGFYVRAQIPENQIDSSLTYFDLRMQPSAKQTLAVTIFNTRDEDIALTISAISASTNQNGLIDYSTPDIQDETLLCPFSDLAAVQESNVIVAANGSTNAYINLEMPEHSYNGVILGGIVISQQDNYDIQTVDDKTGSVIFNQYAYILGVKLTETDIPVEPAFELFDVKADAVDYRSAFVHCLRNKEAAIVKNMDISLAITEEKSHGVILDDEWNIDMAPNSVIHLPAFIDIDSLSPGSYTSHMTLTSKNNEIEPTVLEYTFVVDKEAISSVNSGIIKETISFPLWAWIIIILLIIMLTVLLLILILFIKRRKKEEDES